MTDISNLLALDMSKATTRVVLMVDKEGKESGVYALSQDSPQAQAEKDRQRIAGSKYRAERGGKLLEPEKDEADRLEFDRLMHAARIASALAVTAGWFGFSEKGKELPYDANTMAQLYAKFAGWPIHVVNKSDGGVSNFLMPQ